MAPEWLLRSFVDFLLDLICALFDPLDNTVGSRVSTIAELTQTLITGDEESEHMESTHSTAGSAIDEATPQIEWFFSDQCNWSRGHHG